MAAELLFEIGCEEIPAGFLARAIAELPALAKERLVAARLEHGEIVALGAPRRLALSVLGLAERQADVAETVTGPPASAAFDKEGKPTRAAQGFAQKTGVPVEALTVVDVPGKGSYVAARREQKGQDTRALLPALLGELTRAIPWKKSMRWANLDEAFVRPVHWMVALYAGEVVPLELLGVRAGRETRGHRFLAGGAIALDGTLDNYRAALRGAFVLVDPEVRRTEIEAELARVSREIGVRVRDDAELLAEVVNLVEYPKAIAGSFDPRHLEIPAEVIISAMRGHQRYFATEEHGRLSNRFVTVAGTLTRDPAVVSRGNERVLAARLADARFFFDEDQKTPLAVMADKLGGVAFIKGLGTMRDKVARIAAYAAELPVDAAAFRRAAALAKADLTCKVVGEFPDLQGVMGRHYARAAGEPEAVADAIFEHYLPRGASDRLPPGELGAALGIADRMDSIVGCFKMGLAPSGSNDPYGLRRAALAVLNILVDRGWRTSLVRLVIAGAELVGGGVDAAPVLDFLQTRLRGILVDGRGLPADCVDAALSARVDDVPDAVARAVAVARLRERPDFEPLGVAFKRVANILKGLRPPGDLPEAGELTEPSERSLLERYVDVRRTFDAHVAASDYDAALRVLITLKAPIDKFFDDVLVMDPDADVRARRLALLGTINATFTKIADFRQLAVK